MRFSSLGAAVVLAAGSLVLSGGVLPAQAVIGNDGWRVQQRFAVLPAGDRSSVAASIDPLSGGDAWMTTTVYSVYNSALVQTTVRHWGGRGWKTVSPPRRLSADLQAANGQSVVVAASAHQAWFFDNSPTYVRLNGAHWTAGHVAGYTSQTYAQVTAGAAFGSNDVWVFGGSGDNTGAETPNGAPYAAHYDGRRWSVVSVPRIDPTEDYPAFIVAVDAVSAHDIWAVEATRNPDTDFDPGPAVVLHYTRSGRWRMLRRLGSSMSPASIVAEPDGQVWVGGWADGADNSTTPVVARWNGSDWSDAALPAAPYAGQSGVEAMAPDGTGGLWAVVGGTTEAADVTSGEVLWHLNGGTWTQTHPAFGKATNWNVADLTVVPGTHSLWAVVGAGPEWHAQFGVIAVDGAIPRATGRG
jgi:hypothetical protein